MRKLTLLGIFFLLISFSSAQTYLNIYLDETGNALFLGDTESQNLTLPDGISLTKNIIKGSTNALTSKEGELWKFSYSLPNGHLNLILPKGAKIQNLLEGEVYLDGKQIAVYNPEKIEVSYTIEESKDYNYLFYVGVIIILIIFGFLLYKKFMQNKKKAKPKKKQKKIDKLEIIKQTLHDRQNKIIEKLKEVGEIKQSRLQKLVEIPKASFSRHLHELEKKGIIQKKGEGKNKLVGLKKS